MKFFCLYIYWPKPHASQKAFSLSRCFVFRVFSHRDIILWVWDSVREKAFVCWKFFLSVRKNGGFYYARICGYSYGFFHRGLFFTVRSVFQGCYSLLLHCIIVFVFFFDSAFLFLNFVDFFFLVRFCCFSKRKCNFV